MSSDGVGRLADAFVRRRGELGLSQVQLAKEAGLSKEIVQAIEGRAGRNLRSGSKRKLEAALGWVSGSIDDLLDQDAPPRLVTDLAPAPIDETFDPMTASNEELGRWADRLSEQSDDPVVGVRWMMGIQQKRLSGENSHNSDAGDQRRDTG